MPDSLPLFGVPGKGGARKAESRCENQDICGENIGNETVRVRHVRCVNTSTAPVTIEAGAKAAILDECA